MDLEQLDLIRDYKQRKEKISLLVKNDIELYKKQMIEINKTFSFHLKEYIIANTKSKNLKKNLEIFIDKKYKLEKTLNFFIEELRIINEKKNIENFAIANKEDDIKNNEFKIKSNKDGKGLAIGLGIGMGISIGNGIGNGISLSDKKKKSSFFGMGLLKFFGIGGKKNENKTISSNQNIPQIQKNINMNMNMNMKLADNEKDKESNLNNNNNSFNENNSCNKDKEINKEFNSLTPSPINLISNKNTYLKSNSKAIDYLKIEQNYDSNKIKINEAQSEVEALKNFKKKDTNKIKDNNYKNINEEKEIENEIENNNYNKNKIERKKEIFKENNNNIKSIKNIIEINSQTLKKSNTIFNPRKSTYNKIEDIPNDTFIKRKTVFFSSPRKSRKKMSSINNTKEEILNNEILKFQEEIEILDNKVFEINHQLSYCVY
jgi:hypothetical protein